MEVFYYQVCNYDKKFVPQPKNFGCYNKVRLTQDIDPFNLLFSYIFHIIFQRIYDWIESLFVFLQDHPNLLKMLKTKLFYL